MSARSCSDADALDQSKFHKQVAIIEKGMEAEQPDLQSLLAFEEKAMQKLMDYGEYLSLMMDKGIDSTLRENVREQIKHLFLNEQVKIDFIWSKSNIHYDSLVKLNISIFESDLDQLTISVEDIQVSQHLARKTPQNYQGMISFNQIIHFQYNNGIRESEQQRKVLDFYLKKVEKKFGSDTKFIWQVFLGDISNLN